jgi:EpsI family protein
MTSRTVSRLAVVAMILFVATAALARWSRHERVTLPEPLAGLPLAIGAWSGHVQPPFDSKVVQTLGVDEYVNRSYMSAAGSPVLLYVGYYGDQRSGRTSHSPLKCLPSNGWEPVEIGRTTVRVPTAEGAREMEINRYVVEKGTERQLVLFWYQSRGRVIASEYWAKIFLVGDAVRFNRSDGALVRVIAPLGANPAQQERAAKAFIETLFPVLGRYLPA